MTFVGLHHMQLAMPPGEEDRARGFRRFYAHDPFGNRLEFLQHDS